MSAVAEGDGAMVTVPTLGASGARQIIDAAAAEAGSRGVPASIAVLDRSGGMIGFLRLDGAKAGTVELAIAKAAAAVSFGRESGALATAVAPGGPFFGLADAFGQGFSTIPGGLPVTHGDLVAGAVGVSGGAPEVDLAIARAGLAALAPPHEDMPTP